MDRFLVDRVGLFAVAAIFLITVALSDVLLSGLRLDLTENRLYTLSEGTVNILESIPETVNLYFFFSERAAADNGYLRNYAQRVREILKEFEEYAGSKLRVTAIDPLPFSEEEDRASAFGLQGISLGLTTDQVFLGIAGTNAIGDEETIAFLDPNKETLLEYELARLVYTLANPSKPTIGLISSLPMSGGFDPTTQQPREPWAIATQIQQLFDLRTLVSATQVIDSDFDLLMVVHPKNLSPATLYAIDQYILGGGRAILFVDPYAEADVPPPDPANPAAAMMANRSSNLQEMLDAWGISVPGNEVIGDDLYALQVSGPDQRPIRHLGYLGIDSTGLDRTEVITTDLENIIVGYVGHIIAEENENLAVTPGRLQLAQLCLCVAQFLLQTLFGQPKFVFGLATQVHYPRKGPAVAFPTPHSNKVTAAGKVFESIDDKISIACKCRGNSLPQKRLYLYPEPIRQNVSVGD